MGALHVARNPGHVSAARYLKIAKPSHDLVFWALYLKYEVFEVWEMNSAREVEITVRTAVRLVRQYVHHLV